MSVFAFGTRMAPREAIFSNERIISEFRNGYLLRDILTLSLRISIEIDMIFFTDVCLPYEVPICYSSDTFNYLYIMLT
jgi:hypothetical protein